jgi:hypothetical protein
VTSHHDEVEDKCLDAEAWADELAGWAKARAQLPEATEAKALSAMLRALVKSIRLSLFAEASPVDRGYLIEELESTLATSRALATGQRTRPLEGGSDCPTPPSLVADSGATARPPPGKRSEDVWARRDESEPPGPKHRR